MPTPTERLRTLVSCGLLAETAATIIETPAVLSAASSERDRARGRAFVLYSSLFSDAWRNLWSASVIAANA